MFGLQFSLRSRRMVSIAQVLAGHKNPQENCHMLRAYALPKGDLPPPVPVCCSCG